MCEYFPFSSSFLKYRSNFSAAHNAIITAKVQGGRELRGVGRSFVVSINLFWLIFMTNVFMIVSLPSLPKQNQLHLSLLVNLKFQSLINPKCKHSENVLFKHLKVFWWNFYFAILFRKKSTLHPAPFLGHISSIITCKNAKLISRILNIKYIISKNKNLYMNPHYIQNISSIPSLKSDSPNFDLICKSIYLLWFFSFIIKHLTLNP